MFHACVCVYPYRYIFMHESRSVLGRTTSAVSSLCGVCVYVYRRMYVSRVCVCTYIYIHIYIYVCMYTYTYIYVCIHMYKYMYIYTYIYACSSPEAFSSRTNLFLPCQASLDCVCKCVWVKINRIQKSRLYVHVYIYTCTYICIFIYTHIYIYIYICICIYVHNYIYRSIYIYICIYLSICKCPALKTCAMCSGGELRRARDGDVDTHTVTHTHTHTAHTYLVFKYTNIYLALKRLVMCSYGKWWRATCICTQT